MRDRRLIRRDDRGATLVVVAAFIIVAVIMTAAVVDLGNLRAERKEVTLSTDAAALAAAEAIDFTDPNATGNGTDCSSVRSVDSPTYPTVRHVAERYMTGNGESVLGTCKIFFGTPGSNQMYVTVSGSDDVEYAFGKAIGQAGGSTSGISSARAGSAALDGVLPIGVCAPDAGIDTFVNPVVPFPQNFNGSRSVTIDFENSNCDASGNHDQIDFVAGHPPGVCDLAVEGAFCADIRSYGYDGTIDPVVYGNPGGGGWGPPQLEVPLEDLEARKVHVFVPVIGNCMDVPPPDTDCAGASSAYPVKYLMEVVIADFTAVGLGSGFTFDVYQVVDYAYYQANGLPTPTVNQLVNTHICSTTPETSPCTNNPAPTPPPPPPPPPLEPCDPTASFGPTPITGQLQSSPPAGRDTLLSDVEFTLPVKGTSLCGALSATVTDGEPGSDPVPTINPSGTTITVTFKAADKKFTPGSTYTIELKKNGASFSPAAVVQLTTNY